MIIEELGERAEELTEPPIPTDGEASSRAVPMTFLCWGNRKLIGQKDAGVRRCVQASVLARLPVIARGMTTLVFDADADSVWKLTVDKATYDLMNDQSGWRVEGLPTVTELRGQVGETSDGLGLWLYRQERLQRTVKGTFNRKEARRLTREAVKLAGQGLSVAERLVALGLGARLPQIAEALRQLSTFVAPYRRLVGLDIHASNFMQRAGSNACVLADPFFDLDALTQAQAAYRIRHDVQADVVIV